MMGRTRFHSLCVYGRHLFEAFELSGFEGGTATLRSFDAASAIPKHRTHRLILRLDVIVASALIFS